MVPKTRLDKVVTVRERTEDAALTHLARARATLQEAHAHLAGAMARSRTDGRARAQVEFWQLEEAAHARDLETVRAAQEQLARATNTESEARSGYVSAHREAQVVRRVADRKRTELRTSAEKAEQKQSDEQATQRFNYGGK
jgi:flagellar export protein FliJ